MHITFLLALTSGLLAADPWQIRRNPFTVSDLYIQKTRQTFLEPKSNYIPFEIRLIGIVDLGDAREAVLDIEFEGIREVAAGCSIVVDTPDIESRLRVESIGDNAVVISVNGGEGIRYAIE